jgi:hypothetical protein
MLSAMIAMCMGGLHRPETSGSNARGQKIDVPLHSWCHTLLLGLLNQVLLQTKKIRKTTGFPQENLQVCPYCLY